ncbi:hypothetical protein BH23ACT4_BH23ACT4_00130 [soil metagenome]
MTATDIAPEMRRSLDRLEIGSDSLGLQRIVIGSNALDRLSAEVADATGTGPVVVLEDRTPMQRGGEDLKLMINNSLVSGGTDVKRVVLGAEGRALHADETTLSEARDVVGGAGCVVTVGSGTVTDIGKDASYANGGIPLVVVQTAASVNGYSDDMAVVLKDGVKRTTPSVWPTSLLIDTRILQDAPGDMTASGYAEMMAMFSAPADWLLSSVVGLDADYHQGIVDLYRPMGPDLLASATSLGEGSGPAIELLATLLAFSGIAMGVAGRTAPLSGTEHLISHLIDMSSKSMGMATGLHGAQVGVGAVIATVAWNRLFERVDPEQILTLKRREAEKSIASAFDWLDRTGAASAECWADYQQKLARWSEAWRSIDLAQRWEKSLPSLRSMVGDPDKIIKALVQAGAPTRFSELDPPVDRERARWAVGSAHLMRNRFTILDLATFTGNWNVDDVDDVMEHASELGGGW